MGIEKEIAKGKKRDIQFGGYKWRVLDVQTDRALLLTEDAVEESPYNEDLVDVTWETCTLRKYLNGDFYHNFSSEEQRQILEVNNKNLDNQWFGTEGGNDTKDKVFLLSIEEVVKYFGDSGQLEIGEPNDKWWIDDEYSDARKAEYKNEACWWWPRSPGSDSDTAAYVDYYGTLYMSGNYVNDEEGAVRPAIWLNL